MLGAAGELKAPYIRARRAIFIPLPRRHRAVRVPARGQQPEQRLVGLGKTGWHALPRAFRRRLRLLPPLPRRPGPDARAGLRHLSLWSGVGARRACRRRVLAGRAGPLPARAGGLPRARVGADADVPSLHAAALAAGARWFSLRGLAGALRALLRARRGRA